MITSSNAAALTSTDLSPTITLEETIASDCQNQEDLLEILRNTPLTSNPGLVSTIDVGFTFPSTTPWCLYAAKLIKDLYDATGGRVPVGDWGSGLGFFARHALVAGATVNALELDKQTAISSAPYIKKISPHLPDGVQIKDIFKTYFGNATDLTPEFMARQNQVNVAFNVIHHLTPSQVSVVLSKMFENTTEGGWVVLCCDAPLLAIEGRFYEDSLAAGIKHPGFGVYNHVDLIYSNGRTPNATLNIELLPEEAALKLGAGKSHPGLFSNDPAVMSLPHTGTNITQKDHDSSALSTIMSFPGPYAYSYRHNVVNKYRFEALSALFEEAGFKVTHGWYADHTSPILYPHQHPLPKGVYGSKVVIVAQKLSGRADKK